MSRKESKVEKGGLEIYFKKDERQECQKSVDHRHGLLHENRRILGGEQLRGETLEEHCYVRYHLLRVHGHHYRGKGFIFRLGRLRGE